MTANHDRAALLGGADDVASLIVEHAAAGERLARLDDNVVAALTGAGLFRLGLPRPLGGWQTDLRTFAEVIERLSYADGSAGWTTLIGNSTTLFAWLDPGVAAELVADRADGASTSVPAPSGTGVPDGGGYRISGHWTMNSACELATWFCNGFLVLDGDTPRLVDGRPDWRWAIYPAEQGEIIPTWGDASGLRATGSHDVALDNVLIPHERTIAPFLEPPLFPGDLYRLPVAALLQAMMLGFPLGVGRRALDEFAAVARGTPRGRADRPLAEDEDVQTQLGRAESGLRAARAYAYDAIEQLWAKNLNGDVDLHDRADFSLAVHHAMASATAAVDTAFDLVGSSALKHGNQLQRCWRDVHAASHHIFFSREALRRASRVQLGLPQNTTFL